MDNQVDPETGTIRTRAVFSNRARALTPGLFARVKLVGTEKTNATLVRDAAIGTDQDRKFVLVVGPGRHAGLPAGRAGPADRRPPHRHLRRSSRGSASW